MTAATISVFDSLPGFEVPVGGIAQQLAQLWEGEPGSAAAAPSEFRASQMNLVLHFGVRTDAADAQRQFETVVAFARRYPCRALILCPQAGEDDDGAMRAKIFSECYIGSSRHEMSCCEMVFLSYPRSSRPFLESQVSICLEGDLPLFYWPHRISSGRRLTDYAWLLRTARRILLDPAEEPVDIVELLTSTQPGRVRDLAYARLLPVRQTLGQFLSGQSPDILTGGLRTVTIRHEERYAAEAAALAGWVKDGLKRCGLPAKSGVDFRVERGVGEAGGAMQLALGYADAKKYFRWKADFSRNEAVFEADFGAGKIVLPLATSLLSPEASLGEALFF